MTHPEALLEEWGAPAGKAYNFAGKHPGKSRFSPGSTVAEKSNITLSGHSCLPGGILPLKHKTSANNAAKHLKLLIPHPMAEIPSHLKPGNFRGILETIMNGIATCNTFPLMLQKSAQSNLLISEVRHVSTLERTSVFLKYDTIPQRICRFFKGKSRPQ